MRLYIKAQKYGLWHYLPQSVFYVFKGGGLVNPDAVIIIIF